MDSFKETLTLTLSESHPNVTMMAQAEDRARPGQIWPADRAVDGDYDGSEPARTCTHTALQRDPWWAVDLLELMQALAPRSAHLL